MARPKSITEHARASVLREVLADVKPPKAIAFDHGISIKSFYNILGELGYRDMKVTRTERLALLAARKADTSLQRILAA